MIKLRTKRSSLVAFLIFAGLATACLWDKDTITDELQTRATQYDLVMGQFPSHGEVYYQQRIATLEPKGEALTWGESNDLAVAYIRTEQFTKALPILENHLKAKPQDYHTLSNLGVMYKKQGDYTKAADFMGRALQIKPEGHMGLGDWYLKRLQWSKQYESKEGGKPSVNFLGEKYRATDLKWPKQKKVDENMKKRAKYLTKLIKNDRHFADGYLVMGDLFWNISDLHLAMRCYQHARYLKHPNPDELIRRIDAIIYHWNNIPYGFGDDGRGLDKQRGLHEKIFLTELKETEKWLNDFHAAEATLVEKGETPTFDQTAAENQTQRFRPTENIASKTFYR